MTDLSDPLGASLKGPERDTYIAALNTLWDRTKIPAVIVGAARYVVPSGPSIPVNWISVAENLSLVTEDFWQVTTEVFDEFDWPVRHPNDVDLYEAGFKIQWDLAGRLFHVLQSAGAEGSKRTDAQRRKAAQAIVAAAKKLRSELDSSTGDDSNGDWLGLPEFHARGLLTGAGAARSDAGFDIALVRTPGDDRELRERRFRAFYDLNLQDLLADVISQTEWWAVHVETGSRGRSRQTRFVRSLQNWLREVAVSSGDTEPEGRYWPCVHTANAVLGVRYPQERLVENPARGRSRHDESQRSP